MADPLLSRRLTEAEVDYVFLHLSSFVSADAPLRDVLAWPRSASPLRRGFEVEGVPVLFPCDGAPAVPFSVEGGEVVVRHDHVKGAFFLLSAYQEWATGRRDEWGRFPYEGSVQQELGIERRPVVNYYFKWMEDAIVRQCQMRGVRCQVLSPLGGASLHLSHDIDLVRYFSWRKTLFRVAQVAGLRPCDAPRGRLAKAAAVSLLNMVGLRHDADPYWSFDEIQDNEAFIGHKSDWFVLPDDGGPFPPDYDMASDARVGELLAQLARRGNRIGLHAPIRTSRSEEYAELFEALRQVCPQAVPIVRQHFLAVDAQTTYAAMDAAGLEADFSYGFSRHEGFRNSYCLPFRPFDHARQAPLRMVVVPLALMDVTVLVHRRLSFDEVFLVVGEMLDEVRRFGGLFSLLWHNSTFDEVRHPGVRRFYEDLHLFFSQYQLRPFTRTPGTSTF